MRRLAFWLLALVLPLLLVVAEIANWNGRSNVQRVRAQDERSASQLR